MKIKPVVYEVIKYDLIGKVEDPNRSVLSKPEPSLVVQPTTS